MEDDILSDFVTTEDLKRCEELYNQECRTGAASRNTKFSYACCLVRSKYPADVRKGIQLFEIMYKDGSTEEEKRHCLYYMALGHAKKKDFCESLNLCESFLKVEPNNKQVKDLETAVKKRVKKDGLEGLAMAGSAALVVGGLVGLGLAIASKKKSSSSSS